MTRYFVFLILLIFINSTPSYSQSASKQWDLRYGGTDWDYLQSLQLTADGGYILGGYSYSGISGDKTQPNQGSSMYWMLKTDADGLKQWDVSFGGSNPDLFSCLDQTSDGGYVLAGSSKSDSSGDKTQSSQGGFDYWMVKTDMNGQKQWDARFGGNEDDWLTCMQQTTDGGYILGGRSGSVIGGDKTQSSQGGYDYWIVKVDANGLKQWDSRFGGSGSEDLRSLEQTADGGYIIGGFSVSGISGDKTQASQGADDFWIVKTDANGQKQWDARYGGSNPDILFSMKQASDGGYILGGASKSGISGDKTQSNYGNYDYWIIKTDANGVKQWDAGFGGSDYDELFSLDQATDGGYLLGGYSRSGISGDKTQPSKGGSDFWIVKVTATGLKHWDASFGGSSDEILFSLKHTLDGGFLLGGMSLSGVSGDKTQPSQGGADYWMVKTDMGCNFPQNLSTDNITSNQASIKWDLVDGAIKYKTRYKIAKTSEWIETTSTTANEMLLTGLIPSTKYVWQVKSICSTNPNLSSYWSEKIKFKTDPLKQDAPISNQNTPDDLIVSIYPNPVKDELTIKLSEQLSEVSIFIYDMQGKLISVPSITEYPAVKINTASIPSGMYTVQIIDKKEGISKTMNFVKEN